jgi:hypothetical protein
MTDEIDAAVHRMQAPRAKAALDRVAVDARGKELGARDNPALPRGDLGDRSVGVLTAGSRISEHEPGDSGRIPPPIPGAAIAPPRVGG